MENQTPTKDFKPGDLITAYHKGYHEFVGYSTKYKDASIAQYKLRYDANGKPKNGKAILECSIAFCQHAKIRIETSIKKYEIAIEQLKKIPA